MNKVKVIGGLISLIGSIFLFIPLIFIIPMIFALNINAMINFAILIVAWVGSFRGLSSKRDGGVLTIVAGVVTIVFYILFTVDPITFSILAPYSFIEFLTNFAIPFVTIESLLMIIGGIIILAGGPD